MRRPTLASVRGALAAGAVAVCAHAAEPAPLRVTLSCRPEAAPGRVLCDLRYHASPGLRLVWADALVTRAPDFARPLRSRVTPERFQESASGERRLSLGFVAESTGVGVVTVRARTVTCRGEEDAETCRPHHHELTTELRVGS